MWNALKTDGKRLLLIVVVLLVFQVTQNARVNQAKLEIKSQINTVVKQQCLANQSARIIAKYNDLVQANIDQQTTAARLNRIEGKTAKVAADLAYAARFKADKIPIPTPKQLAAQCAKPLLK